MKTEIKPFNISKEIKALKELRKQYIKLIDKRIKRLKQSIEIDKQNQQ